MMGLGRSLVVKAAALASVGGLLGDGSLETDVQLP